MRTFKKNLAVIYRLKWSSSHATQFSFLGHLGVTLATRPSTKFLTPFKSSYSSIIVNIFNAFCHNIYYVYTSNIAINNDNILVLLYRPVDTDSKRAITVAMVTHLVTHLAHSYRLLCYCLKYMLAIRTDF